MASWLEAGGQRLSTLIGTNAGSYGTLLPATAAVNVKGDWTQVVAATPHAASGLLVAVGPYAAATGRTFLVDIGVGAAPEQVLIENILYQAPRVEHVLGPFFVPVPIPAGTRIAGRCQTAQNSLNIAVAVSLVQGGFPLYCPLGRATTYGAATATSDGTAVDPGTTINTKGAWTQITASCERIEWLVWIIQNDANTAMTNMIWRWDLGIGAAGAEKVVIPDLLGAATSGVDNIQQGALSFPLQVPRGQRIAARAQSNNATAADRITDHVLIGVG